KERSAVWEALSRLPERQRRLLVMKYVEGYSHKAIAEHLGITEQSAWQLLHRAKKKPSKKPTWTSLAGSPTRAQDQEMQGVR
ncbi:MAG: sigma-70 region 4 domain-containing protein, partial [Candidatus Fervidibacter sacchari]